MIAFTAILSIMAVPLVQPHLATSLGRDTSYDVAAALLSIASLAAAACWPTARPTYPNAPPGLKAAWLCAGGAAALVTVYVTATALLPSVFAGPPDVNRGDMLVITEAGVRRVLEGSTPYTMYRVPWEMTLSYGPVLWGPFVIPVLLHADVRILTMICLGATVAALLLTAARAAASRQWLPAVCVLVLSLAFAYHPAIRGFFPIGHTLVYWPLLLIFCALLGMERWIGAAATLGLLIAARTTMISMVPVFLLAAHRDRRLDRRLAGVLALAAIGPFVPFLVADPRSLEFGMYGAYQKTIKGFVWTQTSWAHETIGLTGALLRNRLQAYVEVVQAGCLLGVYVLAWQALKRGARPEPWLALALLVFSMTTLWPVSYVYYDVWVFLIGAFACRVSSLARRPSMLAGAAGSALLLSITATLGAGWMLRGHYDLDVGTEAAAPMTGGGFGQDQRVVDGARDFVWVEGTTARVRAPRGSLTSATISIDLKPYGEPDAPRQQLRVSVNGHVVGEPVILQPGWQTVSVTAPAARWIYGFNIVTMEFSRSTPEPGSGRQLSAGIDRIRIR